MDVRFENEIVDQYFTFKKKYDFSYKKWLRFSNFRKEKYFSS